MRGDDFRGARNERHNAPRCRKPSFRDTHCDFASFIDIWPGRRRQPRDVHFPISCTAVQAKFDRAVALLHNFFYPETVKAFQAIIKEDPSCAMAYWGLAMSELPNPLVPPFPPANLKAGSEADTAGKAAKTQTPRETEYLAAIEFFYNGLREDRPEHARQTLRASDGAAPRALSR